MITLFKSRMPVATVKTSAKVIMAAFAMLLLLSIQGCSNASSNPAAQKQKETSKTIPTPLPLVYANGDVLDYFDPSRAEEVVAIKSAGLSVSIDVVPGSYWRAEKSLLGKERSIAGKPKVFPTVKQLQALDLERDKFDETIGILKANGLNEKTRTWRNVTYWTSERVPERDEFYCVVVGGGSVLKIFPECPDNYFRWVAELP